MTTAPFIALTKSRTSEGSWLIRVRGTASPAAAAAQS